MYRKDLQGWLKHYDFVILDELSIILSFLIAYWIRFGFSAPARIYSILLVVIVLLDFATAVLFGSFRNVLKRGYYKEFIHSLVHVALVTAETVIFLFIIKESDTYSRTLVFLCGGLHLVIGVGSRYLYKDKVKTRKEVQRSVVIITAEEFASNAVRHLKADPTFSVKITGIILLDADRIGESIEGVPVVGNSDNAEKYICREWVDEVFIHMPGKRDLVQKAYETIMTMGVTVHLDLGMLKDFKDQHQQIERMGDCVVLTSSINYASVFELTIKRLVDILGGLVGSFVALLIMAVFAFPIKKASPGPLLYTAERIGQNGKRFRMYKIRSMYMDADARKAELMSQNRVQDGMMFKLDWDPRIIGNRELPDGTRKTGIGEFIRKTSLDEFPQFFNVLKGEMSLVGTRPPTPDEWDKYEYHHRARLAIKPGVTGMWQVSGRSEITDFEQVVQLDTEYITNWNLGLDIKILFKTIGAVLFHKGAM